MSTSDLPLGTVVDWDDAKGFGFIRSDEGGEDTFFHVSSVSGGARPRRGDRVRFRLDRAAPRRRAAEVHRTGASRRCVPWLTIGLPLVGLAWLLLALRGATGVSWVALVYLGASVVAFALYFVDKRRAGLGETRVPEATLHLVELVGGWPGALLGQRLLRHKTRKTSFQVAFWAIVALHVALWAWWLVVRGEA